jgi:hypothetical protein
MRISVGRQERRQVPLGVVLLAVLYFFTVGFVSVEGSDASHKNPAVEYHGPTYHYTTGRDYSAPGR